MKFAQQHQYYVKCYINGLRPEIKHYLKPFKPATLYDEVENARDMELGVQAQATQRKYNPTTGYQKNTTFIPRTKTFKPTDTTQKKEGEGRNNKPEHKFREPGTCRYCGGKCFFGHKCAQYKTLNIMATEESTKETPDEILQGNEQLEDNTPSATTPTEEEQCMQISSQAVGKKPTAATFSLKINIGGKCGIALVDSGSSHTFIDMNFTVKTTCQTVNNALETIHVVGGGTLQIGSHVVPTPYTIHGHKFKNSFKVLPLKGYDIILGRDWLAAHNPITMAFVKRKMQVVLQGKTKVTLRDNNRKEQVPLISVNRMQKLSPKGVSGYCLFPVAPDNLTTHNAAKK